MDRNELQQLAEKERAAWKPVRVRCCTASGCLAADSANVKKTLELTVDERKLGDRVDVVGVGCLGLCGRGPLVGVDPGGALYERVTTANAPSILNALEGGMV